MQQTRMVNGGGVTGGAVIAPLVTVHIAFTLPQLAFGVDGSIIESALPVFLLFSIFALLLGFAGAAAALGLTFLFAPADLAGKRPGLVGALAGLGHTLFGILAAGLYQLLGLGGAYTTVGGWESVFVIFSGTMLVVPAVASGEFGFLAWIAVAAAIAGFLAGRFYGWCASRPDAP